MLATKGFAQGFSNRKYFGLQFGIGAIGFNSQQYNSLAAYSGVHEEGSNVLPQMILSFSVFPVTSKYNIDISGIFGFDETDKIHQNVPLRIATNDGFKVDQSITSGDINFSYRVIGTSRMLAIPSIGVGFMQNDVGYIYQTPVVDDGYTDDDGNEVYDGGNNKYINLAKNKIGYLNFRLNFLLHAHKSLWYGLQLGYKYSFTENHILYNPDFPVTANHLLNRFYASLIIAL